MSKDKKNVITIKNDGTCESDFGGDYVFNRIHVHTATEVARSIVLFKKTAQEKLITVLFEYISDILISSPQVAQEKQEKILKTTEEKQ